ncbi:hypothetical protein KC678_05890 [Candidatus Dojkabacteria bacterium]|uniref:Uncharacterized protein n=1 Tax=Candidatus Dojkabacteria bacterium TaxID=2099670 RepID=A0A955L2L1_9BACT|nr:hypothetical protein [Candidatus Dojkabacteria bacterium]
MKASELKKDGNFSGRINKEVLAMLKKHDISVQKIVDNFLDELEINIDSARDFDNAIKNISKKLNNKT